MGANRINIDYVKLNENNIRLNELNENLLLCISHLEMVTDNLEIFWEGEADNNFHTAINTDYAAFKLLINDIEGSIKRLQEGLDSYQKTEVLVNQMIGGIKL